MVGCTFYFFFKVSFEKHPTLQAALESLQGKEIQPVKVRGVQVQKAYDGGNLENNEYDVGDDQSQHGDEETEAVNDALGEVNSDAGAKLEVQKESGSRRLDVDDKLSMPISRVRSTEKGMGGTRKALAGPRDEIQVDI